MIRADGPKAPKEKQACLREVVASWGFKATRGKVRVAYPIVFRANRPVATRLKCPLCGQAIKTISFI